MTLEDTMATATKTVTDTASTATGKAKEYGTTAVTTMTDTATAATGKAKEYGTTAVTTVTDTATNATSKAKDTGTAAVTTITDSTSAATEKATEYGTAAATALNDALDAFIESGKDLIQQLGVSIKEYQFGERKVGERAEATVDSVKEFQIGDKKVAERATATVHSVSDRVEHVSERIDVEQIQDQVAKLRHQMEGVVGTWKESFRPSEGAAPARSKKAPAKAAAKDDLTVITGIGPVTASKLNDAGITTFASLATAPTADVSEIAGTTKAAAAKWVKAAKAKV